MQCHDDLGIVGVVFAPAALGDAVVATHIQNGGFGCSVGGAMTSQGVFGDLLQADATNLARGAEEAAVHDFLPEPDGFEDLGAAIAGDGGDTHLGHHFKQSGFNGLTEVGRGFLQGDFAVLSGLDGLTDGIEGNVRIDRTGAESDETRKVVDVPALPAFADDGAAQAFASANEMVMDGSDGQ